MPAASKSLFFEYHRTKVGRTARGQPAQIGREWVAKSPAQRVAWVGAYKETKEARKAVTAQKHVVNHDAWPAVNAQRTAIQATQRPDEDAYYTLFWQVDAAKRECQDMKACYERLATAWTDLRRLEGAQPQPHPRSTAYSAAKAIQARTSRTNVNQAIAQLDAIRIRPPVPQDPVNGEARIPEELLPGGGLQAITQEREDADAANGNVGLAGVAGGTWLAKDTIFGGQSRGTVWLNFDHNDRLVDRVFRKDVYLDDEAWFNPRHWEGDVKINNSKRPWEVACHVAMNGRSSVVGLRDASASHRTFSYRLYLNWTQHRDLHDLIDRYRRLGSHVPEPMVWHVAESLAEAGLAMEGQVHGQAEDWAEIVHREAAPPRSRQAQLTHTRDIKPSNVFLDGPDPRNYPWYPKPLLGDFGLAFRTTQDDRFNPLWYNTGLGTPGFFAPEQKRWRDANTLQRSHNWKLGAKTNVYGVGVVLYCMVMNETRPKQPLWFTPGDGDDTLHITNPDPFDPAHVVNNYSTELTDLINDCLEFRPNDRPTFTEMWRYIQREIDDAPGQPDCALGMHNGTATGRQQVRQGVDPGQVKYTLQMTWDAAVAL